MRLHHPLLALAAALAATPALAAPRVVASIQPVHALVAGVMQGVAEPRLLVPAGRSPHGYQLRPSEAEALRDADLVVWVGEALETFLVEPVEALAGSGKVLELMDAPGMALLDSREGGAWDAHEDHDGHAGGHDHGHGHDAFDPHIWLSAANARAIVGAAATALAEADPPNAAAYAANAARLDTQIDGLETELAAQLAPVRAKPFIVLHDAFQYFDRAFDLAGVGSITVNPDRPPSAKRLRELRQKIAAGDAVCVFAEPQTSDRLVASIVEGTGARTGMLDAEGSAGLPPGAEGYFALMRRNARALADCLSRSS